MLLLQGQEVKKTCLDRAKADKNKGFVWLPFLAIAGAVIVSILVAGMAIWDRKTLPAPARNAPSTETDEGRIQAPPIAETTTTAPTTAPALVVPHAASSTAKKFGGNATSSASTTGKLLLRVTPPPPAPVPTSTLSSPIPAPTSSIPSNSTLPPEIEIHPETVAGILCYFDTKITVLATGKTVPGDQALFRGSGVIINDRGYILTNRHLIQQPQSSETATDSGGNAVPVLVDYTLNHCEVGQVPAGSHAPTVDEIRTFNPTIRVGFLAYNAEPIFISPKNGLSAGEIFYADFAVLRITGISGAAPTFGITSLPKSFPYAKILAGGPYLAEGQQILTYGFPGDVTLGQHDFFETLTMTGSVGAVTKIEFGDKAYADTPLIVYTKMELSHGRSGSPLFWRGYVVGLTTFFIGDNRTDSGSVASDAIIKALKGTGYLP